MLHGDRGEETWRSGPRAAPQQASVDRVGWSPCVQQRVMEEHSVGPSSLSDIIKENNAWSVVVGWPWQFVLAQPPGFLA